MLLFVTLNIYLLVKNSDQWNVSIVTVQISERQQWRYIHINPVLLFVTLDIYLLVKNSTGWNLFNRTLQISERLQWRYTALNSFIYCASVSQLTMANLCWRKRSWKCRVIYFKDMRGINDPSRFNMPNSQSSNFWHSVDFKGDYYHDWVSFR